MARVADLFNEADLAAIREATRVAESRISGEIVTTVVESCDAYEGALWKSAAFGAMLAALVAGASFALGERWSAPAWWWLTLPAAAGAGFGYLVPRRLPFLHRALVGGELLDMRLERSSAAAFVEEEVFATRERSGVLIFVGLFEHRVQILRDKTAQQRVPADSWDDLAFRLARDIGKGQAAAGLVQAIEDTGRLLELHGLARRDEVVGAIDDQLRLLDD
jgi:putative membrane protein